jgi:hypothetical protein
LGEFVNFSVLIATNWWNANTANFSTFLHKVFWCDTVKIMCNCPMCIRSASRQTNKIL